MQLDTEWRQFGTYGNRIRNCVMSLQYWNYLQYDPPKVSMEREYQKLLPAPSIDEYYKHLLVPTRMPLPQNLFVSRTEYMRSKFNSRHFLYGGTSIFVIDGLVTFQFPTVFIASVRSFFFSFSRLYPGFLQSLLKVFQWLRSYLAI